MGAGNSIENQVVKARQQKLNKARDIINADLDPFLKNGGWPPKIELAGLIPLGYTEEDFNELLEEYTSKGLKITVERGEKIYFLSGQANSYKWIVNV